jgi:hypothetical protein
MRTYMPKKQICTCTHAQWGLNKHSQLGLILPKEDDGVSFIIHVYTQTHVYVYV